MCARDRLSQRSTEPCYAMLHQQQQQHHHTPQPRNSQAHTHKVRSHGLPPLLCPASKQVPSALPPPKEKKHCSKNKRPKLLNSKKLGYHNISPQFSTAFKRSTIYSAERRVFSLSHHPSRSSVVMTTSPAPCRRLLRAQRSQMRCRAGLWGKYLVSSSAVESGAQVHSVSS